MPADPKLVRDLFLAVAELPEADRAAYLQKQVNGNTELQAAVERLLAAHEQPASLLNQPAPGMPTADFPGISERPGTMIGPYKLMEQIGEGGFGLVFVAEQTEPVKRKVALKVIKPGMDSKQVIARFEAERQALAMMDHPHIARVLDAGTTESGRPYFVMELVRGIPITEYCDKNHLTPTERLELFVNVCHAIQHAHQKGIIHRDIKPSNVLVTSHDGKPVAKVIDFGVAKAIHQHLTERTIYTQFAQMIGTPLYMSPEQAEMSGLDIDTRSDIYSLGVLLYELLTGSTPLERKRLAHAAFDEIRRVIREEDPPRPSDRLSTSETLPSLAANRKTEPARLSRMLKGELDWIVMKALEKDRTRRYETANGFARDIQRYLSDEVVEARPASAGYRLRKLMARNKGKVLAAGLVLSALLVGIIGTTWGLVEAEKQKRSAMVEAQAKEEARQQEVQQRQVAQEKEKEANEERAKAVAAAEEERKAKAQIALQLKQIELVNDTTFDIFAGFDIRKVKDRGESVEVLLAKKLNEAGKTLDEKAITDPLVLAKVRNRLGMTLLSLGYYRDAIELFRAAQTGFTLKLGPDHPDTLNCNVNLVEGYIQMDLLDQALPLCEETFQRMKDKLGPDHIDTLNCMSNLAAVYMSVDKLDRAVPLYEETFKLVKIKLGPDHRDTLACMGSLAVAYRTAEKFDLALSLYKETLEQKKAKLGLDHPDTLVSMGNLAEGYQAAGRNDLAIPLFEETLNLQKVKLGPDHPDTLANMGGLALSYLNTGKLDKALAIYEETFQRAKARLGPDHRYTLNSMAGLAQTYQISGKLDKALPLWEEALQRRKARIGPDHHDTLTCMYNLASCYHAAGKLDQVLPLLEETFKRMKAKFGADHPSTLKSMNNLAQSYHDAGKLDQALPLLEETFKRMKAKFGADHPSTLTSMNNLASGYRTVGKLDLALPLNEETFKRMKAKFGADHPDTLTSMGNLASCYWSLKQLDKSVPLFEQLLPLQEKQLGRGHPSTQLTVANLGVNYKDAGRLTEAIPLLEEAYQSSRKYPKHRWAGGRLLEAYTKANSLKDAVKLIDELLANARNSLPKDSPQLSGQLAQYAMILLEIKGFTEAEPLLRKCLAIREKTQPDAWNTFNTQSMLGGALLGQKKYAEAEPLLLKGYEGMKAREKTIPPQGSTRLPEALDRLIQLYTETNKPDELKKWQAEKEKLTKPAEKK